MATMRFPWKGPIGLALLAACSTTPAVDARVEPEWDDTGTVWGYLSRKYDADGDGAITRGEYGRDDESFERMDGDGNALLTAEDFAYTPEVFGRMRMAVARAVVERYFQGDDVDDEITLDELFVVAQAYDANGDELVVEAEFRAHASACYRDLPLPANVRMMGEFDPWEGVMAVVDEDRDGQLAFAELGAFFEAQDDDADFVWKLGADDEEAEVPSSGPTVGSVAPDFALTAPDGASTARLSSFAGDRPVALIFGSAT